MPIYRSLWLLATLPLATVLFAEPIYNSGAARMKSLKAAFILTFLAYVALYGLLFFLGVIS